MINSSNFLGFNKFSFRGRSSVLFYLLPIAICFLTAGNIRAQEQEIIPDNVAPPPLRIISKSERSALESTVDVKVRAKLAVDLMEARLKKAEELNSQESFTALLDELGSFEALMDNTLNFLNRNNTGGGKVMDTFKKFEIALRAFMPRIESIRRDLPDNFEFHVRSLLRTVRDARSKSIEPFFSNTVVPGERN